MLPHETACKAGAFLVEPHPRLHKIGIHRNRTYYAATANPEWHVAFERFRATERAEFLIKRGFLQCISSGLAPRSSLEAAAAGSLRELIEKTLPYLDSSVLTFRLRFWLDQHPPGIDVIPKFCRISRKAALQRLKTQTRLRAPYVPSMNYNRHLVRVCPLILREGRPATYSEEVLRSYCVVQWPLANESGDKEANSLLQWILVMVMLAQKRSSAPA